jgi:hypothetical protein
MTATRDKFNGSCTCVDGLRGKNPAACYSDRYGRQEACCEWATGVSKASEKGKRNGKSTSINDYPSMFYAADESIPAR